jgi:protein-S-isoprenylcysteine O-methyltransferase Ste14
VNVNTRIARSLVLPTIHVLQLAELVLFAVVVSDFRRKPGMAPLVGRLSILAMTLCYPVPTIAYGVILLLADNVTNRDGVALVLVGVGTACAALAKRHLGSSHAWTGHYRSRTRLVTEGVYRHVRHPMYLSIAVAVSGSFISVSSHAGALVTALHGLFDLGILAFLSRSAFLESRQLAVEHGERFAEYKRGVRALVPLTLGRPVSAASSQGIEPPA